MKRKRIAVILVALVCLLLLLMQSAFAASVRVSTRDTPDYFQYYNANNVWTGLSTPEHYITVTSPEQIAYCLEHKKTSPSNSSYSDTDILGNYSARTLTGLRIILENGYPYSSGGLTASQARYATANAIRFWLSEQGEPQFYNFTNFGSYTDAQLRAYAANGTIPGKVRANLGQTVVLQYSIELLIEARSQTLMPHTVAFSSMSMSISGSYFVGTTKVTLTNLNGGYTLNKGALPSGSTVTGYTGKSGDVLTVKIPMSKVNSNKSYTLSATGYDNRMRANMAAYDASSSSIQAVVTVVTGTSTIAASASIAVKTPAVPDLIVSAFTTNKASYEADETVTVMATIKNQGTGSAGAFKISLSSSAIATQNISTASLGVDATRTITFTFTAPTYTSNTNLMLTAKADSANSVTELDETNNTRSIATVINAAKPDLTISSLTANKTSYNSGETVTVTAVVRNQGKASVPVCEVRLSSAYITAITKTTGSIAAGGTATVTYTFTAPSVSGTKAISLTATADPNNKIVELDETNNTRSTSVTVVGALPDLTVSSLYSDKSAYEAGETVTITACAANIGNLSAQLTTMKLEISGIGTQTKNVPALAVNGSSTLTFTFTAPTALTQQTVTLKATIDPDNTIAESNENNNTRAATLGVNDLRPDITITDSTAVDWYAGKEVVVSATVKNLTAQDAPSVKVRLTVGDIVLNESIPVPGNGSNLAVFRFTVPEDTGTYEVTFEADPSNAIEESNEGNNVFSKSISVVDLPSSVVIDPDNTMMEQQYSVYGLRPLPSVTNSAYHTWQEVRLENGSYITKTYWARLTTEFNISPDGRIAYDDRPDVMESGYGVQGNCTTTLSTNYDQPQKLIGSQMAWVRYPESCYGQTSTWQYVIDRLEADIGDTGDKVVTWRYSVNPYSVTASRLHYVPLWFPDREYTAMAQAFYAWSPAGQLYGYATDNVTIEGDMYDRITTIRR